MKRRRCREIVRICFKSCDPQQIRVSGGPVHVITVSVVKGVEASPRDSNDDVSLSITSQDIILHFALLLGVDCSAPIPQD